MEKINNLKDQLDSLREMKTIKKLKGYARTQNHNNKTKNTFDMFISIVDTAEEKVSKLKISQQTLKMIIIIKRR